MKTFAVWLLGIWVGIFVFGWMDTQPAQLMKWNGRMLALLLGLTLLVVSVFFLRGWWMS